MSDFIMFGLGFAELGVGIVALALSFWIINIALSELWARSVDRIQFYKWLAEQNQKHDNNN